MGLTCGILPIGGAATVTTLGLRWNLRDAETRFGGLVSTSNHLAADEVVVETSECVVFTVEIRRGDDGGVANIQLDPEKEGKEKYPEKHKHFPKQKQILLAPPFTSTFTTPHSIYTA